MKIRIMSILFLTVFCIAIICPLHSQAATPLDPAADAALTLYYQKDDKSFSDLQVDIYRVAEAFSDGSFELMEPFSSYPINIYDITLQEEWSNISVTLSSYIIANGDAPYREGITNENGVVSFEDLETGLYLVSEAVAEDESGTYIFNQFMVYLPTYQEDGSYDYEIEARPKCADYVAKNEYKVIKLWKDSGNKDDRPEEVTVDIYKDGKLHSSCVLNSENDWSYTWQISSDDDGKWSVAERDVPEVYTVTIQQSGECFTITNTHTSNSNTPNPPETGDTFSPLPWIMLMCASGMMLIVIGIYRRRLV